MSAGSCSTGSEPVRATVWTPTPNREAAKRATQIPMMAQVASGRRRVGFSSNRGSMAGPNVVGPAAGPRRRCLLLQASPDPGIVTP